MSIASVEPHGDMFLSALRAKDRLPLSAIVTDGAIWSLPGLSRISGVAADDDADVNRAELIASYGLTFGFERVLCGLANIAASIHKTATRGNLLLDEWLATVLHLQDEKIESIRTFLSDVSMVDAFLV